MWSYVIFSVKVTLSLLKLLLLFSFCMTWFDFKWPSLTFMHKICKIQNSLYKILYLRTLMMRLNYLKMRRSLCILPVIFYILNTLKYERRRAIEKFRK